MCATQMAVFKLQTILSQYDLGLYLARNFSMCLTSSKRAAYFSPTHDVIRKAHKHLSIPNHLGRFSLHFLDFLYTYFLCIVFIS